jgi:DNA-binding transcriptional MerR regulator
MGTEMNIGDFAARTELSVSAVRFYADRGLLPPVRVDAVSGYRLYAEDQVETGKLIRDLRRMNMSLVDIGKVLAADGPEQHALVQQHLTTLEAELRHISAVAQRLGAATAATASVPIKPTPNVTETPMPNITAHSTDLAAALEQVLPAAGTDPHRPHLMTVLIEAAEGSIRVVATDSHRCAVRDLVPLSAGDDFSAVVSAATMVDWQTALTPPATVTIQRQRGRLTMSGDGVDLDTSAIDMTFPPYEALLSAASPSATVVAAKAELLSALARFDGEDPVHLRAEGETLTVTAAGREERVAATCDQATDVAVDPRFAEDAVRHAVGAEVIIEIDGTTKPLVFRSADDGTYTSLLMAVNLIPGDEED